MLENSSPAPASPADPEPGPGDPSDAGSGLSRRGFLAAAPAVLLAGGAVAGRQSALAAGPTAVRASRSDVVADMLGVSLQTSNLSGPYQRKDLVKARLKELGARYLRDRLFPGNAGQIAYLQDLAAGGIRSNLVMGDPNYTTGTPEQLVSLAASRLPGAVASFEGANEWDIKGGANWVPEARTHQQRLFRAVQADSRVAAVPVLGPSLGLRNRYDDLGNLAPVLDRGNVHLYQGGYVPNFRAEGELRAARQVSGSKPIQVTETGWHNLSNSTFGHNYTPEDVAGTYAPRMLAEYFRVGVRRVYLYEFCDRTPTPQLKDYQQHFGLVRTDFSRKPAFTSLANLIRLVSDRGPSFRPGELVYVATGPDDLQQVLLQRRDGRYLLLLWRNVSIYNPDTRRRLSPANQDVRVLCPTATRVRVFRPSGSSAATIPDGPPNKTDLRIGGEMVVLEITSL